MLDRMALVSLTLFLVTASGASALQCFQCFDCDTATKIECNATSVIDINEATSSMFQQISHETTEKFDCITLAYLTDRTHAKIQGCVYNSMYACSLKPKDPSTVYICGTCDTNFCNSAPEYSDRKILFTLLSTMLATFIARIL